MENFFAYGTLMCEDIMREVTGVCPAHAPGIVRGYSRRAVKGEVYPALVPDQNGRVKGVVYRDMPNSVWACLDRFEGEMYARQIVQVTQDDGTVLSASTYVAQPPYLQYLESFDWDYDEFLRNDKVRFHKLCRGFT